MDLNISFSEISGKLVNDPIRWHLIKKATGYLLVATFCVLAVWFTTGHLYKSLYSVNKLLTQQDSKVLAVTNAEINEILQLVSKQAELITEKPKSFGDEVQVRTERVDNPFVPLVQPKPAEKPQEKVEQTAPSPQNQLKLEGIARVGQEFLIIIADANGNSQVLSEGEVFNGWKLTKVTEKEVRLTKGKQSLMLAWEGK
ncbi:MAG: hypothetical protein H0Z38_07605 [Firmicutes bacterium]|nr:hypothetical protein [Bacillota bacterium]